MDITANFDDAIEHLLGFESQIDDDFNFGLKGFINLDEELKNHVFGFVKVGICAERIRRFKLWERAGIYNDFADYCKRGLGKTCWYINRTIDAAKVVMGLIQNGFKILPQCESQCRPLIKAAGNCEAAGTIADFWSDVVAKMRPDKITAGSIESIVNGESEEKPKQGISKETIEIAKKLAKLEGKSVDDLIRELLRDRAETIDCENAPIDPDRIEITPEQVEILDELDRQWKKTPGASKKVSIVDNFNLSIGDSFDRVMTDLVGRFIPPARKIQYE